MSRSKGNFVCLIDGVYRIYPANRGLNLEAPSTENIAKSQEPIWQACRVVFYGSDGSRWLMKDLDDSGKVPRRI